MVPSYTHTHPDTKIHLFSLEINFSLFTFSYKNGEKSLCAPENCDLKFLATFPLKNGAHQSPPRTTIYNNSAHKTHTNDPTKTKKYKIRGNMTATAHRATH